MLASCSSGGGGSVSGVTVPDNAIVFDESNAVEAANTVVDFTSTTDSLFAKNITSTTSAGDAVNLALDKLRAIKKNNAVNLATGITFSATETLNCSTDNPDTEGNPNTITITGNFTLNDDFSGSATYSGSFVSCNLGIDLTIPSLILVGLLVIPSIGCAVSFGIGGQTTIQNILAAHYLRKLLA